MKKRVLFVSYNAFNRGGIQNVVMNIVKNLSNEYTFDLLCFQEDIGKLEKEFLSYGGKIIKYQAYYSGKNNFRKRVDYYLRGVSLFSSTLKAIRENGPYQAIHCNNAFESGICLRVANKEKIPVRIAHSHTAIPEEGNVLRRLLDKKYRCLIEKNATHQIGCSQEACDSLFLKGSATEVIPNFYDDKKFFSEDYPQTPFPSPRLIQIASFGSNKNQLFSVEVLCELKKQYPQSKLIFVGYDNEPGYLQKIESAIIQDRVQENIEFYPSNANLPILLNQSSYFLLPSFSEGFGLAPVEAQAMGVRCFVSDSVPRLCDCGGCTFLPLGDGAKKWAETIIQDYKQTNGKHAKYDCSKYAASNGIRAYEQLYRWNI